MNDAAPRTRFITCMADPERPDPRPREYCGGLVLDIGDVRRYHREWHAHEKNVKDKLRDAIKAKDNLITDLVRRIEDMERDVENIDIPAPIDPIEVSTGGWSDDDEPESELEPDEDELLDEDDPDAFAPTASGSVIADTAYVPAGVTYGPGTPQ